MICLLAAGDRPVDRGPEAHTLALGSLMGDFSSLTLNNTLSTGRVTEVTNGTIGNPWYSSRFTGTMAFSFTGH
ncbi:MAG TPA: hypothetical protein VFA20_16895 [Myxococcaceae bacterium]|nr:hypothetical protein [Myxococcaceae bacterium]